MLFDMAMKRVDSSVKSTYSVLELLTVCYIRFLDLLYAIYYTEIDEDRYTLIELSACNVLKVSCISYIPYGAKFRWWKIMTNLTNFHQFVNIFPITIFHSVNYSYLALMNL